MNTRSSTRKSDAQFYMLDDSRRMMTEQDFDKEGKLSCYAKAGKCQVRAPAMPHLCGWACSCFLTRLNFFIGAIIVSLIAYGLHETTDLFDFAK